MKWKSLQFDQFCDTDLNFKMVAITFTRTENTRVDSRDLQMPNISIWRYHCLGEEAFLKIWNQYWLLSDTVHQRFLFISPTHLQTSKSLQVPNWIDSSMMTAYLVLLGIDLLVCVLRTSFGLEIDVSLSNASKISDWFTLGLGWCWFILNLKWNYKMATN